MVLSGKRVRVLAQRGPDRPPRDPAFRQAAGIVSVDGGETPTERTHFVVLAVPSDRSEHVRTRDHQRDLRSRLFVVVVQAVFLLRVLRELQTEERYGRVRIGIGRRRQDNGQGSGLAYGVRKSQADPESAGRWVAANRFENAMPILGNTEGFVRRARNIAHESWRLVGA